MHDESGKTLLPLKLRETMRLNTILVDNIPHPAMLLRRDTTILAANAVARQMGATIGKKLPQEFAPEGLRARSASDMDLKDGRVVQSVPHAAKKPLSGDHLTFSRKTIRIPNHRAFGSTWDIRWIPVEQDQYLLYAINISEFQPEEERVHTGTARSRELFDHFSSAGIILQPQSDGTAFIIIDFNENAERFFNINKTEAIGKDVSVVFQQFGEFAGMNVLQKVLRTGRPENRTIKRTRPTCPQRWLFLSAFKLPSGKLVMLLEDIANRRTAETALRDTGARHDIPVQTMEAPEESEKDPHLLSSMLLKAQEEERRRISRELHDELGQSLLILKLQLKQVAKKLPTGTSDLVEECANILHHIDGIIENVRRLSRDLRPPVLEDLGLSAALRRLIKDFCEHHDIRCSCEMTDLDQVFSLDEQLSIYRILQEALTNVARHADAKQVVINIDQSDRGILFVIDDDGKGFNVPETMSDKTRERGLGLAAMKERARMLSGCLEIQSTVGRGTSISLLVPHIRWREN